MKTERGFTVIELMVVVAMAALLVAVAIPGFKPFIERSRMTSATNELVAAFHIARNEAIKQRTFTCICSSATAGEEDANRACDAGSNWESGWLVFTEQAGPCDYTPGVDRLINAVDGADFGNELTIRSKNVSISLVNYVRFTSRGSPQQPNGAIQQGVFSLCDARGLEDTGNNETVARAVSLSAAGSVRSSRAIPVVQSCP